MSEVLNVKPRQLRPAKQALRNEVVKKSLAYQELVESLRADGFLNSISGSAITNEDGTPSTNEHGEPMFEITDGFHRWTAASDLGMEQIPFVVTDLKDRSLLALQIAANAIHIVTTRAQYAQALKQMIQNGDTVDNLGRVTKKGIEWVKDQLSLTKLPESVQKMIDLGQLNALNSYNLAKLPPAEVENFLNYAMTETAVVFQQRIEAFLKAKRKAEAEGRVVDNTFKPMPLPRKTAELKALYTSFESSPTVKTLIELAKTPKDAARAMLEWAIQMDPESIAQQKLMYDTDLAKKAAADAKKLAEKEAKKKAAEAALVA